MELKTIVFYEQMNEWYNEKLSWFSCVDCYNKMYTDDFTETPYHYGVKFFVHPICHWCKNEIKKGVELYEL